MAKRKKSAKKKAGGKKAGKKKKTAKRKAAKKKAPAKKAAAKKAAKRAAPATKRRPTTPKASPVPAGQSDSSGTQGFEPTAGRRSADPESPDSDSAGTVLD